MVFAGRNVGKAQLGGCGMGSLRGLPLEGSGLPSLPSLPDAQLLHVGSFGFPLNPEASGG